MKFVSVLLDTYNHERFIEEAIASVLEQDFAASEVEILVVDGGSTDRTAEIVRKFEPRVKLLKKANGGQASAFNAGIPECQGEIVAFLDGDDWWNRGKLTAVVSAFEGAESVGLVGHGITEMFADGTKHEELLKETERLRLDSAEGARMFRLRKSFLGTSRMAYRRALLKEIGLVPEILRFEADEFLFTVAGFLSVVEILRESYTFYRMHDSNAFQIGDGNTEAIRRKQYILETLSESLESRLKDLGAPAEPIKIVTDWIKAEAELLRLELDNGYPWETIRSEIHHYRVLHAGVSNIRLALKCLTLIPGCFLPSKYYFAWRQTFLRSRIYQSARKKWMPFSEPSHVDRYRTIGP